jgi:hypothetical protein
MQSGLVRFFLNNPDSDDLFLKRIQDPSKRQELLNQLEQSRMGAARSLVVGLVLAAFLAVLALFRTDASVNFFGIALAGFIVVDARAQYFAADTKIKMIKLYTPLT